ncbi:hypothetical protein [Cyclobacterium qasimii]|uniref:Uncharacterized protein n=1 Tax=Cyclobacterium qasimii M12-11B TaxID=641524 RepID=S7VHG9_9BACT|nr:hypothetical protein [Cyclobacterium qasimii]EPR69650.1 hypothetical protein ADICYQ_1435 [Cyclobacterium qasimii M12-11B]
MKKFNNKTGDSSKKSWGDKKEPGKRTSYSKKKDPTDKTPEEKSEYKGRGRNQKPIFGKVEDKNRAKKPFKNHFHLLRLVKIKQKPNLYTT